MQNIGVIFDCDGTLVDSMPVWRELEEELAARAKTKLTDAQRDMLTGLNTPEAGEFFHTEFGLGESAEDVVGMICDYMMEFYSTRSEPRPGALEFVSGLAEAGIPIAVASSTRRDQLVACLEHAGFAPYLKGIVSVEDVGVPKRFPNVYHAARETLGTPIESTWGFEDALYAVRTLNAGGYPSVGIYDCDMSGTEEDLRAESTLFYSSFEGLTAEAFLSAAQSKKLA